jgi:hypothetical protein
MSPPNESNMSDPIDFQQARRRRAEGQTEAEQGGWRATEHVSPKEQECAELLSRIKELKRRLAILSSGCGKE